jgi:hypothetical protein
MGHRTKTIDRMANSYHNHAFGATTAPVSVMVSVTTHFDTHTGAVVVAVRMHFAPVPVTMVAITTPDADAKLFGAGEYADISVPQIEAVSQERALLCGLKIFLTHIRCSNCSLQL